MPATVAAAALVVVSAAFGLLISWHHRKLDRWKIIHIFNCEDFLGLHRDDVIPKYRKELEDRDDSDLVKASAVKPPEPFSLWRMFDPTISNTAVFIMRMHVAIMAFAVLFVLARLGLAT